MPNYSDFDTLAHRIAFAQVKGMQGEAALEMLKRLESPADFFRASQKDLIVRLGVNSPNFSREYRDKLLQEASREAIFVNENKIQPLFISENGYSERLRQCSDAPGMLFQLGACSLNAPHIVSIVGTRHATPYGLDFTSRLVADLARLIPGVVIVSGLAYGVDVAAHKAALSAHTPTIAVLAHGLSTIYPADHRNIAARIVGDGGALLTEFGSAYQINRGSFLARNRIIAGLADCVVVIESDLKGGSMSTARTASLYGREVLAVPGRVSDQYSRGTNRLIATNTAALITSAQDLVDHMGWEALPLVEEPQERPLTPQLQQIYDFILKNPELTVNDICVRLALPYATVSDRIFQLEMDDRIIQLPGGRFGPVPR